MDGSPSAIISLGLGSWGSTGLVMTLGLGIGAEASQPFAASGQLTVGPRYGGTVSVESRFAGGVDVVPRFAGQVGANQ